MFRIGIILVLFGIIYLIKPNIYKRWIWKKTNILQRNLSPANYLKFMRILGGIFILVGILLLLKGSW